MKYFYKQWKIYKSENLNNKENKIDYYTNINSLDLLLNYIINYSDINTSLDNKNNNLNKAIDIFSKVKYLKLQDVYEYIEQLFDTIKLDSEHKSIIQSVMLIIKIFTNLNNSDEMYEQNLFEKLNNKYRIFNLIIDDLIRYISLIKEKI